MSIKDEYDKYVKWEPIEVKGLTGYPCLSGWEELDWIEKLPFNWNLSILDGNKQFSQNNRETLIKLIKDKPNAKTFVEIGTASNFVGSSTETFLLYKNDETDFITIDIENREHQTLNKPNIFYIQSDSTNPDLIRHFAHKIDILFIDGDHSIKTVFKEYKFYLPHMKEDGIIVLHDTTMHPGPFLFMQAVDEKVFKKETLHTNDFGLGVIYLK